MIDEVSFLSGEAGIISLIRKACIMYNKNTKLYKNCILEYIKSKSFDYSILVNGDWGSGKTYYFNNEFCNCIKDKYENYRIVYISASDSGTLEDIEKNIATEFFVKGNFNKLFFSLLSYVGKSIADRYISVEISNSFILCVKDNSSSVYDKIKNEDLILVIDDLERYNGNIEELFAMISSKHIARGVHAIYVANENEIISKEEFYRIKEKYIRNTLLFYPTSFDETILSIANSKDKKTEQCFSSLFNKLSDEIVAEIKRFEITNLRTITWAIDCYDFFVKKLNTDVELLKHFFIHIHRAIGELLYGAYYYQKYKRYYFYECIISYFKDCYTIKMDKLLLQNYPKNNDVIKSFHALSSVLTYLHDLSGSLDTDCFRYKMLDELYLR